MRLICPNCGAQYEVPTEVIPEGGRDVQCSNCNHTWFQTHAEDDPVLDEDTPGTAENADESSGMAATPAGGEDVPKISPDVWADDYEDEGDDIGKADLPPPPPRRSLDPNVADLLREEAEREARVRAAEGGEGLESQPELGLDSANHDDAASRRARVARERMARIRNPDTAADMTAGAAAVGTRKALLPDIEAINSTLRASSEPRALETPQGNLDEGGSGFARGFISMLLLMAVLIGLYVMAPSIKQWVPDLGGVVDAYLAQVDALRIWLANVTQDLLTWLDGMSSEAGTD